MSQRHLALGLAFLIAFLVAPARSAHAGYGVGMAVTGATTTSVPFNVSGSCTWDVPAGDVPIATMTLKLFKSDGTFVRN